MTLDIDKMGVVFLKQEPKTKMGVGVYMITSLATS